MQLRNKKSNKENEHEKDYYVIGLLLLVIAGCAIYCIVQAMWTSLAILAVMGLTAILAIFLLVWVVVKAETIGIFLGEFIRS